MGYLNRSELFGGSLFEDEEVQIRVVSTCRNGLENVSSSVSGNVDLIRPSTYGKPIPQDGVYDIQEEFITRFNEQMNPASVNELDFSIRGDFNGANSWSGAFAFSDGEYVDVVDAPNLLSESWMMSMQIFPDQDDGGNVPLHGTIISQVSAGNGFEIRINSGTPEVIIHNSMGDNLVDSLIQISDTSSWWSGASWKEIKVSASPSIEGFNENSEATINITVSTDTEVVVQHSVLVLCGRKCEVKLRGSLNN